MKEKRDGKREGAREVDKNGGGGVKREGGWTSQILRRGWATGINRSAEIN